MAPESTATLLVEIALYEDAIRQLAEIEAQAARTPGRLDPQLGVPLGNAWLARNRREEIEETMGRRDYAVRKLLSDTVT